MTSESVVAFDPWRVSDPAEVAAHIGSSNHGPTGPFDQWQAAQEVTRWREACMREDGGRQIMRCVALCAIHALALPPWLRDAFVQRHNLVSDAYVATWDEAFGRPWPKRTRMAIVRRRRVLKQRVHAAVWTLIRLHPKRSVNRSLFEEVGRRREIARSGSEVESLYYEALDEGMLNVATWRNAGLPSDPARIEKSAGRIAESHVHIDASAGAAVQGNAGVCTQ